MSNIKKAIISILLVIILLSSLFITPLTVSASSSISYTSALDDLKRDPKFDINNYPADPESSEIKLIHIGEGEDGELYVYTYQPGNKTKHYKAKYINMSLQNVTDENIHNELYSLTWLNSDGVFDKYVVNKFNVTKDVYRYYNITAIYRIYDETVDSSSSSIAIDSVQCKAFPVGQVWCLYYYNNVLMYEMETVEYVEIKMHATGTVRYYDGFSILFGTTMTECDVHYVAFSVDNFNVDKICDADITYTVVPQTFRLIISTGNGTLTTHEDQRETITKTLTEFDTGSNKGTGLLGKKYEWNRISTVTEFVERVEADSNDKFSTEELEALNNSDFVFRFLETEIIQDGGTQFITTTSTKVENIGILRLHFLSEGPAYNLGVVGDLVGTDSNPELEVGIGDNILNTIEEQAWWQKLMAVLLLILLVILVTNVFFPIAKPIFKIIMRGVGVLLNVAFSIITFPLRLIFNTKRK